MEQLKEISPQELKKLLDIQDVTLIDVREDFEYQSGFIEQSIHIKLSDLEDKIDLIKGLKKNYIVMQCRSGVRSKTACTTLEKHGIFNSYNLTGGILAWNALGFNIAVI